MNTKTSSPESSDAIATDTPYQSPTLLTLRLSGAMPDSDPHNPQTVCEHCKAAVWTMAENDLRAYCRVMHLVSWSKDEPNNLVSCDGQQI